MRLDQDAVNHEKMLKLQRSRSEHQGHLTELNNKISVLLFDAKNEDAVKELVQLFNIQWERFSLVHHEILLFANHNQLSVASATEVYEQQVAKKPELLAKVSQYLQSRVDEKVTRDDFETRSCVSVGSFSSLTSSAKSAASSKSREAQLKREKAELCLNHLHDQQEIEKTVELRNLEMRQLLERQKLKDEIEIAKLEERHAAEDEQLLYIDEKLYNYADFSKPTEAPKFEYYNLPTESARTKGQFNFADPKRGLQNYSVVNNSDRETDTNVIHQLAETLASLSHTPPIEIIKFSGDPKDYFRFATRFRDQVLSQPIQESKMLSRLMQYLDGKAKEAVERFEGMGSGALAEALNVLKTRFGQSYMIVDAYIGSIVKGPSIANGDGKALQKRADKCQSVLKIFESMNSLNEINSDHLRKVVARLPFYNQSRWRDRAGDLLRE